MNKYVPHVYVIPEDRADEQLANGFVLHNQVKSTRIQVMRPAGGWRYVLQTFQDEYIRRLREDPQGHVVMLIDFDGVFDDRRREFDQAIPDDLRRRVFVVGPVHTPEILKAELGKSLEEIGTSLADDCYADTEVVWGHEQLRHNDADLRRLITTVKPILFGP